MKHEQLREMAENYVAESWGSFLNLDQVDLVMAGIGVGKMVAKKLEAENENLKVLRNYDVAVLKAENEKAKEIIKDLLRDIPNRMWYTDSVIKKAEDFIKD